MNGDAGLALRRLRVCRKRSKVVFQFCIQILIFEWLYWNPFFALSYFSWVLFSPSAFMLLFFNKITDSVQQLFSFSQKLLTLSKINYFFY